MLKPPTSNLLQGNCPGSLLPTQPWAVDRGWAVSIPGFQATPGDDFHRDLMVTLWSGMINGIYLDLLKISYFPTVKSTTWEIYIGYIEYVLRFCRSLSKFRLFMVVERGSNDYNGV